MKLVEALTLVINLYPGIVRNVYENFIFSLQPELISKLACRLGAQNIMLSRLSRRRFK